MALSASHRYRSADEDSTRWDSFAFRPGDIVISTRSKSGTTWVQMICALLVFETADLPAPLPELSPWLDWTIAPVDEVHARLAAQQHRRFIKTHTPIDGLPLDPRVTYVVVARHPLDAAASLYHQGTNLDRARIAELSGGEAATDIDRPPLHEWLVSWVEWSGDPQAELDSLPGVVWHLTDAWERRNQPNVVLVHYDDLWADLDREMRRLADELGFVVDEQRWPALAEAAGFDSMRAAAPWLAPDPAGVLKDPAAFFRRGGPGAGRELLSDDELARYEARAAQLAAPDLLAWLHHGRSALGDDRMGR